MHTLKLANPNWPGHHVTIQLADDDGEPESASCECDAEWRQCSGPAAQEWASHHIPPPHIVRGTRMHGLPDAILPSPTFMELGSYLPDRRPS